MEGRRLPPFTPHPLLHNAHAMTIVSRFYPRGKLLRGIPVERRLFTVAPETQILALCHWQREPRNCHTVLLVHGLEGCSESHYMHGLAAKAWKAGFNVLRLNQRTCGGTEHLAPSLYNCGMSDDVRVVAAELASTDRLDSISIIGYSMGGNLVLKMAGEVNNHLSIVRNIYAVCPNIDPAQCILALERPGNRWYHDYFFTRLRARIGRKAAILPGKWDLATLQSIKTIRELDHYYTAPDGGYTSASHYYDVSGARHVLADIRIPTVIIAAHDDPFIPSSMFSTPNITNNPFIELMVTRYGGHCGFFQRRLSTEDNYWVENRLIGMISQRAGRDCSERHDGEKSSLLDSSLSSPTSLDLER